MEKKKYRNYVVWLFIGYLIAGVIVCGEYICGVSGLHSRFSDWLSYNGHMDVVDK